MCHLWQQAREQLLIRRVKDKLATAQHRICTDTVPRRATAPVITDSLSAAFAASLEARANGTVVRTNTKSFMPMASGSEPCRIRWHEPCSTQQNSTSSCGWNDSPHAPLVSTRDQSVACGRNSWMKSTNGFMQDWMIGKQCRLLEDRAFRRAPVG